MKIYRCKLACKEKTAPRKGCVFADTDSISVCRNDNCEESINDIAASLQEEDTEMSELIKEDFEDRMALGIEPMEAALDKALEDILEGDDDKTIM